MIDGKQPSAASSSVGILTPAKKNVFDQLVRQVLAWTKPEEIEAWREEVETLADSDEKQFLHAFPEKKEKWRTEHVITWLAGCAPGLGSEQLVNLKKQGITGASLLEDFSEAATSSTFLFPFGLVEGSYSAIRFAVRRNLLAPGAPSAANLPPATSHTELPLMSSQNMTPNLLEMFAYIDKKLIGVDQQLLGVDQKLQSLTIRSSQQPTETTLRDYHAALVQHQRWQQEDHNERIFPKPSSRACTLATELGVFGKIKRRACVRKTIQPAWSAFVKRIGSIQKDLAVEMLDRHNEPTIGTNRPDLVGYFKESCQCEYNICLVGELKSIERSNSDSFGAEDFGLLEMIMERLLTQYQPYRLHLYGFLSDGRIIQYLCASRHKDGVRFVAHSPQRLTAKEGIGFLCELLMTREETAEPLVGSPTPLLLHAKEPQSALTVTRFLGQGRTAFVYEVKLPDGSCAVAKIFKPDCLEYYGKELYFLRETANVPELEGRIAKLVLSSPPEGYFFLSPVGVHFACSEVEYFNTRHCLMPQPDTVSPKGPQFVRAKPSTFAELVSILKILHSTVKLCIATFERIISSRLPQDSATEIGVPTMFAGALEHAPDEVLDHCDAYKPKASDDLVMLVRAAFEIYHPNLFHDVHLDDLYGTERNQWIKKCWRHFFPVQSHWFTMQRAALSQNYDQLQRLFQECLPAHVTL